MSLARRSRAVATARPRHAVLDDVQLAAGVALVGLGVLPITIAPYLLTLGLVALAYQLGKRLVSPERSYMEGFTDGLTAADSLAAIGAGDQGVVPVLPASVVEPDPRVPDGGTRQSQRFARSPVEQPLDFAAVAGVTFEDRHARPSTGTYVDEPIRSGPRPPDFPPVPANTTFGDFSAGRNGETRA